MLNAVNSMKTLNALFSKGRIEVLRSLFRGTDVELHLREITRQSGLNLRTVQRELRNLTDAEIIVSRRDGNRQYFKANKNHPVYRELTGLVLKSDGVAEALKEALKAVKGIQVAFIFGSIAKGAEKAASDIDLMVIGEIGLRPLVAALRPVGEKLGRVINPYNTTAETWKSKLASDDTFIKNVAGEDKILIRGTLDELEGLAK
jgi:DNA-binding transcriptional ArsR family regulator